MVTQLTLIALFTFLCGFYTCYLVKQRRIHFLIASHLLLFWINILLYGLISAAIHDINYEPLVLLILLFLILSYIIFFYLMSPKLKESRNDPIFDLIAKVPQRYIRISLLAWLLAKIYLYYRFGLDGFWILAYREKIGANEIEIIVNAILSNLAFGAVFIYAIKIGTNLKEALRNPITTFLCILSLFIFSFLNADLGLGARRTLIFMLVVLILSMLFKNWRVRVKHIFIGSLLTLILIQIAIFYQSTIRPNIWRYLDYGYIFLEIKPLFNITDFIGAERYPPTWLLYQVTNEQIENFRPGEGRFLWQTVLNSIPRILFPQKNYVDQDELLWELYNLPRTDLPTSILVSFQAEISFLAYLIVPIMLVLIYKIYRWLILFSKRVNTLLTIGVLGNLLLILQNVEASLDSIIVTIRNTFFLLIFFLMIHMLKQLISRQKAYLSKRFPIF